MEYAPLTHLSTPSHNITHSHSLSPSSPASLLPPSHKFSHDPTTYNPIFSMKNYSHYVAYNFSLDTCLRGAASCNDSYTTHFYFSSPRSFPPPLLPLACRTLYCISFSIFSSRRISIHSLVSRAPWVLVLAGQCSQRWRYRWQVSKASERVKRSV